MATMGSYCKAYPVGRLREFGGWSEKTENLRPAGEPGAGGDAGPRSLGDEDFLYLQENFTVTDGIFLDEAVVFDQVSPEWVEFCKNTLRFEVPDAES